MKTMHPATAALFAIAFLSITGCETTGSRGAYPDSAPDTQLQADNIRADAKLRKDTVDRNYDQQITALAFREKQIKEKARQDREASAIERDKTVGPLSIKQNDLRAAADRERKSAEFEIGEKLKNPGDQEAQLKAELASRKAEIDRKEADQVGPIVADIDKANAKDKQNQTEIAEREAKQLSDVALERDEAKRQVRERKLDIDRDASAQLEKLSKKSEAKPAP